MNAASRGKGLAGLATGRVVAALLSWIWLVVVARNLSVEDFGTLALLLAIGAIVGVVADLGLPLVLMDTVSANASTAWTALVLTVRKRLVAGTGAAVLSIIAFRALAPGESLAILLAYTISILSTTVYTSVNALLRAVGSARVEAANEALSRLGVLTVGSVLLAMGGGLMAAVMTYAMADFGSAIVLWFIARRRVSSQSDPVAGELFSIRRTGPLAASGIVGTLYNRIDVWLLALLRGSRTVALYAAAYRLLDGILLPSGALSALVIPRTAGLSTDEKRLSTARLVRLSVGLVAPLAAILAVFGGAIIRVALGHNYAGSATLLPVLLLAAPTGAAVLALAPLAAIQNRSAFLRAVVAGLSLNVAANVLLIPRWGAAGAAWATVVAQAALAWLLWRVLWRRQAENPGPIRAVEQLA